MKKEVSENWLTLDNAAKIYPANASKRDTRVFRFVCELKEEVCKDVLQKATLKTLEQFPYYKSTLKRGIFWYYLEYSEILPRVLEEHEPICAPIYDRHQKQLLFKVTYYKKRINLEVFHALSDGAGAIEFLRALVANYLMIKYPHKFQKADLGYKASINEKEINSFEKYYMGPEFKNNLAFFNPYRLKGRKLRENRLEVIEGKVSTSELKIIAKKYNTTITIFLTAVFMLSISDTMKQKEKNKPIVMTIPVNLRQFFKSYSARNFFGVFNVGYNFAKESNELQEIINYLNKFFENKLNKEQMSTIINSMMALEKNILLRAFPLFIKDIVLKIAYGISDLFCTGTVSNVGIVKMPEEFNEYIELFDCFMSTNKIQMCILSFNNNLMISITSPFINTDIQKNFFTSLSNLGLDIIINSNNRGEI